MNNVLMEKVVELQKRAYTQLIPIIDNSPDKRISVPVLKTLAKIGIPEAREKVCQFFSQYPDEEESIEAISIAGGEQAFSLLRKLLDRKDSPVRDLIVECIAKYKTRESFECLKELLGDSDRVVRYQAIEGLFLHGGRESALALCKYISDPDEWISMNILKVICKLKEHESVTFLVERFKQDDDLRRKAQMVSFLAKFRSVTLLNVFDEGLKSHDPRLKANSIEAIGELELPQREISQRITPFLRDPNNRIRANAILSIARSESETVKPQILEMVKSDDIQLRRSAAYILGQISPVGYEDSAKSLASDESDDVRKRMILSLKKFPTDLVKSIIEKCIQDENAWIRKFSVEMAIGFDEFPFQSIIQQFKKEDRIPNLLACMDFFSKHPNDEAVKLIKNHVRDKRPDVVSGALKALASLLKLDGLRAIARLIDYREPKIFKTFTVEHFSLGGLEIFDSVLKKVVSTKPSENITPYLSALEGCLEILEKGENVPKPLFEKLNQKIQVIVPAVPVVPTEKSGEISIRSAESIKPSPESSESKDVAIVKVAESELESKPESKSESSEKTVVEIVKKPKVSSTYVSALKFFNIGKYRQAKKAFFEALQEDPGLIKAHYYIGAMAWETKEVEQARESLTQYLASEPNDVKALSIITKIYKKTRDWANLRRACETILQNAREDAEKLIFRAKRDLGVALAHEQKFVDAQTPLEDAYQLNPDDEETVYYLAMACYNLGNFRRAESLVLEVVRILPKDSRLYTMVRSLYDKICEKLPASDVDLSSESPSESPSASKEPVNFSKLIDSIDKDESVESKDSEDSEKDPDLPDLGNLDDSEDSEEPK
ncbi:MAG: HEAT repeat domain-containing protein [Candidatus Riflebacteria bacterium]|nr:HEAT repeat domain-containing protein [Candidatus Riflebacteria bacterium]